MTADPDSAPTLAQQCRELAADPLAIREKFREALRSAAEALERAEESYGMLRADFNDCNSERARRKAQVDTLSKQLAEAEDVIVSAFGDIPTYGSRKDAHIIARAFQDHASRVGQKDEERKA